LKSAFLYFLAGGSAVIKRASLRMASQTKARNRKAHLLKQGSSFHELTVFY
jgi:hypothetical protein